MVESPLREAFDALRLRSGTLERVRRDVRAALAAQGHSGRLVAVSGGGRVAPEVAQQAHHVGAELARRGAVTITGGLGGVMAAASQGARSEGGLTIGLLPGTDPSMANPHVAVPIATGWREGRNFLLGFLSDGLIAIDGGDGTLSEVALARKLARPVVGLALPEGPSLSTGARAETPDGAVGKLWAAMEDAPA